MLRIPEVTRTEPQKSLTNVTVRFQADVSAGPNSESHR